MPRQKLATVFAMVDPDVHWRDELEDESRRSSIYDHRSGQWLPPDGRVAPDALAGRLVIDTERVEAVLGRRLTVELRGAIRAAVKEAAGLIMSRMAAPGLDEAETARAAIVQHARALTELLSASKETAGSVRPRATAPG